MNMICLLPPTVMTILSSEQNIFFNRIYYTASSLYGYIPEPIVAPYTWLAVISVRWAKLQWLLLLPDSLNWQIIHT